MPAWIIILTSSSYRASRARENNWCGKEEATDKKKRRTAGSWRKIP